MRQHGAVNSGAGLVPFGHLGWGYRRRSEFLKAAAEYIADGVRRNQCVVYVGDRSRRALEAELCNVREVTAGVTVTPADEYYIFQPGSRIIDAEPAVASYLEATENAISKGYSGFRAVVDVTSVARTPDQRDALASLEYLVDRQMAVLPFSAMCAYDVSELGAAAAELICLHPLVGDGDVHFRLYAQPEHDADFALAGEIDLSDNELFATALRRMWPLTAGDVLRIDARDLEFIGPEQLRMLDRSAAEQKRKVVLYSDRRIVMRVAELLGLANVSVDHVPSGT